MITYLDSHVRTNASLPEPEDILAWIEVARSRLERAATNRSARLRDFAATLIFAVSDGRESVFAHIGDGAMAFLDSATRTWIVPTWPNQGEYASTTFFVTDAGTPETRICQTQYDIAALAAFSDGIERLSLDFAAGRAHAPFLDPIMKSVVGSSVVGRDARLSSSLHEFLDSDRVNSRTDDDKTLVLAIRR